MSDKNYLLSDEEFMEIDDKLYPIIQKALNIKYELNKNTELFAWYCEIRDNLCKDIGKKRTLSNVADKIKKNINPRVVHWLKRENDNV